MVHPSGLEHTERRDVEREWNTSFARRSRVVNCHELTASIRSLVPPPPLFLGLPPVSALLTPGEVRPFSLGAERLCLSSGAMSFNMNGDRRTASSRWRLFADDKRPTSFSLSRVSRFRKQAIMSRPQHTYGYPSKLSLSLTWRIQRESKKEKKEKKNPRFFY